MRRPYPRFLAAGLAVAASVTAFATSPAAAATRGAAPAVHHTETTTSATELLLNGDRVLRTGPRTYGVVHTGATGFAGALVSLHNGTHTYEIPAPAFAYLGHGLDPSLFDVSRLPRTGTLPVTVSYRGLRPPALPGITLTSTRPGVATGSLASASAQIFIKALVRQYVHDHATGRYGTDGLFANGTTIRLTGAPLPARPARGFRLYPLTVKGIALNGKPDVGDSITVFNTDNFDYFSGPFEGQSVFYNGIAKFSVPAGHYNALGLYTVVNSSGSPVAWHLVVDPGFTVAGNTAVTSDARMATSAITLTVPRPVTAGVLTWTLALTDKAGASYTNGFSILGSGFTMYVNPTSQHPLSGSLRVTLQDQLTSPTTAKSPYNYNLSFADPPNVITKQVYHATSANLATITARYYSDVKETGGLLRSSAYKFSVNQFGLVWLMPVKTPLQETEYLSAGAPAVYWSTQYIANQGTLGGGQSDSSVSYPAGEHATNNWNAYPLHSSLNAGVLGSQAVYPVVLSATRAGDDLSFQIFPFGDNTPGHNGAGYWAGDAVKPPGGISGRYVLDENGKQIAAGNADQSPKGYSAFIGKFKVAPAAAAYQLTLTADRAISPYVLSTKTSTTWTWRSAHESGTVLPLGWVCPNLTRKCASQPLLTMDYDVANLGLNGVAPAGSQVVKVSVTHQQAAAASAISGLTASVSADGGKTWQPATVKGSGSTWYASFSATAGSKVSLRIGAKDSAGGAISETVLNAYAINSSAASAGYRSPACATQKAGHVSCFLAYDPQTPTVRAAATGFNAGALAGPTGWGAPDIQKAYKLPVSRSGGTVALVEWYDTPKLETYLNVYRKQYGLGSCTTANGCFRKVNQNGKASPLPQNGTGSGADLEATLDVDMVSAVCPKCHILVVEANSPAFSDVAAAENTAARLGAVAISNSYGARETGYSQAYASAYNHPGHTIVASSGDTGWGGASFPANLTTVTAVGGTQLSKTSNSRGYSEVVWNTPGLGAASSGCSAYVAKPKWQHDKSCPGRTVADVSALAYNVAIYNTDWAKDGWLPVAETSAASPIVAGIYALAGNATKVMPGSEYAHPSAYFDVTTGNNDWWNQAHGKSCDYTYLCVAKPGYDAPTGLGTPNGITGF
jgi:hypothetical protein